MIDVLCVCGKSLTVGDDKAGKRGKCPACGASIQVPDVEPEPIGLEPSVESMTDESEIAPKSKPKSAEYAPDATAPSPTKPPRKIRDIRVNQNYPLYFDTPSTPVVVIGVHIPFGNIFAIVFKATVAAMLVSIILYIPLAMIIALFTMARGPR